MKVRANYRPAVAIVGEMSPPELDAIVSPLTGTANWTNFAGVDQVIEAIGNSTVQPELIVLAQSRPGNISHADVRQLHSTAPLAGIFAVLGSWCEGETRSGDPWPGVARCYQHEWPLRWREESRRVSRGEIPLWTLPATFSQEERLLARCRPAHNASEAIVAVVADSGETASTLRDACRAAGLAVSSKSSEATTILWDTTIDAATDVKKVTIAKTEHPGASLIAMVTFPRAGDIEKLLVAGVDAVLAKPFLLDDLLAELDRLMTTR